jgi:hypothetical protein
MSQSFQGTIGAARALQSLLGDRKETCPPSGELIQLKMTGMAIDHKITPERVMPRMNLPSTDCGQLGMGAEIIAVSGDPSERAAEEATEEG